MLAFVALTGVLSACSGGSKSAKGPAVSPSTGPAITVFALGGSATEGDGVRDRLRDAWPYLVFHNAFPLSTVFVNGALDDATIKNAIVAQVPLAVSVKPDLIEVFLGADDVQTATPLPQFASEFTDLVTQLKATGAKRILVADLPVALGGAVADYNAAIHATVTAAHVELVPLAQSAITLAPTDGLPPQPDTASHKVIAAAFEKAIAQQP